MARDANEGPQAKPEIDTRANHQPRVAAADESRPVEGTAMIETAEAREHGSR